MSKTQKKGPAFLLKTFDMLEKEEFKQIIDWIPDGTGFVVKSPLQLAQKVLPKYFKHSNMHSFIRQLNMYGFNKKRGSKTQNYYFHLLFHKGQRDMIGEMQRKAEKKGTQKQLAKQSQPNEQVSIEVQQEEEQSNEENKKILLSQKMIAEQNIKRESSQLQQSQMKKNVVEITAVNKVLLLEQIYHLANIQANNLLVYHQKMGQDQDEGENKQYGKELMDRFRRVKSQYLRIHSLIWDKASSVAQNYQNQLIKNAQITTRDAQMLLKNGEVSQKDNNKATQVEINKNHDHEQNKQIMEIGQSEDSDCQKQQKIEQEIQCQNNPIINLHQVQRGSQ